MTINTSSLIPSSSGGQSPTKTIKTSQSVNSFARLTSSVVVSSPAIVVTSGSLTAATLATLFSYSGGPGEMSHFSAWTLDATARTMRIRITIDGITSPYAFDYTSANAASANTGVILAGGSSPEALPSIKWNSSILIEWASSLTESALFAAGYIYQEKQ